jgi:hypothetical protein
MTQLTLANFERDNCSWRGSVARTGNWSRGDMNRANGQLQIPDRTTDDPRAFEIVRVWVAHGEQHVAIRVGAWKKPGSWGIVLAE